jgi:hypothetical protein
MTVATGIRRPADAGDTAHLRGSTVIRVNRIRLTSSRERTDSPTQVRQQHSSDCEPRPLIATLDGSRRDRNTDTPPLENFRPPVFGVDSTRRNSLIRWQKRAAMWEHGFESRWGHHRLWGQ